VAFSFSLHQGDSLETLKEMEENSIDSIVTDPPYGLKFMGKKWDHSVPSVEIFEQCLRVLKPGGHLLAFAGTRTQHRMAVNIEDAGFEIRDMIAWVYGSGFPKSQNVGKAIDKARTEDKEPVRVICRFLRFCMENQGLKSKDLTKHFGDCHPRLIDHWAARDTDSQPSLPTWEQWQTLKTVLALPDLHDVEVWRLNGRKGKPGDNWDKREIVGSDSRTANSSWLGTQDGASSKWGIGEWDITAPATPEAQQWDGWGTALKPALEPITVARKPFKGTVAGNVLEHGTGAINIDGCRVADGSETGKKKPAYKPNKLNAVYGSGMGGGDWQNINGRWPANLIHDGSDEVTELFPQAKPSKSGGKSGLDPGMWAGKKQFERGGHDDNGGSAARFFQQCKGSAARFKYCAKANKKDRGEGNNHPTVKPTDLMAYLVRLVTPPGGVVLDPFMGSGSTGKACKREGFNFIGCDLDPDFVELARKRIEEA
jgi:DNA modification methylase